ncbi:MULTISPECIES: hypothetical protein [unclassified Polaromonas]|jgi:hypothetical protein|uniref:hypothetical protein n=1 Tax=unclassified Polaromonas TaxID=2638319 RepID=UPI000BCEED96|nr:MULTISPECIES: hypothetical protein [unclassified Polaromonas]OYY32304.1 MAG: hypothetical protein B7Y60_22990 [Polaromonas sp. 35-63-35]OYZ15264.1 MAG: hypothetical protein B7Y28_22115 [Polaromonas sp. 16-63-31]OYZ75259.1 MAG: hypothetical protein B7Y09_24715 [Polaromonas sp. 24-63-21]OZA45991.1 MAG: hypothetical protein B7X88_23895 [Polaromonas sp. 17-63-33]OZA85142.1 MAG: hypothetical protein B7X65_22635 [Polaromonas sp. 39-63-25]
MIETLLMGFLNRPWIASLLGQTLVALGGVMMMLGIRVGRIGQRIARIFDRHGLEAPDVMSSFPWWLRMLTPETVGQWIVAALVLASGAYLIYFGKWARKQLYR